MATKDLGTAILGTALTKDDTILAEVGGSIRRIPVSVLADVLRALASENNTRLDNQKFLNQNLCIFAILDIL